MAVLDRVVELSETLSVREALILAIEEQQEQERKLQGFDVDALDEARVTVITLFGRREGSGARTSHVGTKPAGKPFGFMAEAREAFAAFRGSGLTMRQVARYTEQELRTVVGYMLATNRYHDRVELVADFEELLIADPSMGLAYRKQHGFSRDLERRLLSWHGDTPTVRAA